MSGIKNSAPCAQKSARKCSTNKAFYPALEKLTKVKSPLARPRSEQKSDEVLIQTEV
jgi:hypothetical protein